MTASWQMLPVQGSKSNPSNYVYRPVSLTVNLCKTLESLLRDNIVDHLEKHRFN